MLYPKQVPLSVNNIFVFPVDIILLIIFLISCGDKNWPFFIFIILLVFEADIIKSVCLDKNAGIWIISTTSETIEQWDSWCTSVNKGQLYVFFKSSKIRKDSSKPIPL